MCRRARVQKSVVAGMSFMGAPVRTEARRVASHAMPIFVPQGKPPRRGFSPPPRAGLPAALAFSPSAQAADPSGSITVGLQAGPTSADPHFHQLSPNNALARHVFGTLVASDAQL